MKRVIMKPLISEKSISGVSETKYTFEVNPSSNKTEIKNATKSLYKVNPISINIVNVSGKIKNFRGRSRGMTKNWKKAIITLKKGQKIPGFEIKEEKKTKK